MTITITDNMVRELSGLAPVNQLAEVFAPTGFSLALVGGSVRDALAGRADAFADLDFTTDADPETVQRLLAPLGTLWEAGLAFGTVAVSLGSGSDRTKVEVTTWRTERYDESSRKPEVTRAASLEEDLSRRDFTINAMAIELTAADGPALVDPFGGAADLAAAVIRTPGDPDVCFTEDPLRMLRMARFAARFDASVDPLTLTAARRNAKRIAVVAAERITAELDALCARGPQVTARALGVLRSADLDVEVFGLDAERCATLPGLVTVLDGVPNVLDVALACSGGIAALTGRRLPNTRVRFATATVDVAKRLEQASTDAEVTAALRHRGRDVFDAAAQLLRFSNPAAAQFAVESDTIRSAAFGDLADAPLPIDGNDLVAAGLNGPAVGRALAAVEQAFCTDPGLDRLSALQIAVGD